MFNSTDIGRFLLLQKFVTTTVTLMCTCKALAENFLSEFAYMRRIFLTSTELNTYQLMTSVLLTSIQVKVLCNIHSKHKNTSTQGNSMEVKVQVTLCNNVRLYSMS